MKTGKAMHGTSCKRAHEVASKRKTKCHQNCHQFPALDWHGGIIDTLPRRT